MTTAKPQPKPAAAQAPGKPPIPRPEPDDQAFWDATKKHELVLQRCTQCKEFRHPPQLTCPNCYSEQSEWAKVSGRGTIYTFIVVHQPTNPAFLEQVPYNIVQVTPDEAPNVRIMGNVVGTENSKLKVGMPVKAVFDDVSPEVTMVRWGPR